MTTGIGKTLSLVRLALLASALIWLRPTSVNASHFECDPDACGSCAHGEYCDPSTLECGCISTGGDDCDCNINVFQCTCHDSSQCEVDGECIPAN